MTAPRTKGIAEELSMSRRSERRRTVRGHVLLGPLADLGMTQASCELDAAGDRLWFRQNPGAKVRVRPASPLELAALGLAHGTTVRVRRLPDGAQVREFYDP
jgi:hypothetical protein